MRSKELDGASEAGPREASSGLSMPASSSYDGALMESADTERTKTNRQQLRQQPSEVRRWALRVIYSGGSGIGAAERTLWDGRTPLTLGRRSSLRGAPFCLPIDDEKVSREHAQVFAAGSPGTAFLRDCDSKNGTWVSGQPLRPGESRELTAGDLIQAGDSLLLVQQEPAQAEDAPVASIVGTSVSMRRLRSWIVRAAPTRLPVLLLGETGTGKGVAAQALHRLSGRRGKLVHVNCAAIPETLAESLFFGVQRGAFTGAVEHAGFFGEAHQGTLFLDEVGDLPLALQAKLLQALDTKQVTPLGGTRPVAWEVRIVAATNRNLAHALAEKGFRADLYARLAAEVLSLSPLRERREDILLLARHRAEGSFAPSPRLAAALVRYDWPLNVREVGHVVAQISAQGEEAVAEGLEAQIRGGTAADRSERASGRKRLLWQAGDPSPSKRQLESLLEEFRGNLRRIEVECGFSRRQLHRWAEQHSLDIDAYRERGAPDRRP